MEATVAIGHSARYLFDDLYLRLFDTHEETRQGALRALRELAPSLREFHPVLIQELQSPDEARRLMSIEVIKQLGDSAVEILPYLANCENDDSFAIRRAIATLSS